MSNDMPKDSTPTDSLQDLAKSDAKLDEITQRNEESLQNIKKAENEKLLDDAESLRDNAKIVNALGKFLVWLFFGNLQIKVKTIKIYFIFFWIIAYIVLNVVLHEFLCEKKALFYISLIDKIGLFLIVCILGKFLKDNISNIIKIFNK